MLKALACCLTLLAIAIGGPADAQPSANGTDSTDQHDVTLSGSDYEEIVEEMAKLPKLAGSSGQALLTAMETWVSSQFDLPAIHEHPRAQLWACRTFLQSRHSPQRPDCVAGHERLELTNVAANYPFERSHRFAGIQPNSGFGDYSRLSCGVGADVRRNFPLKRQPARTEPRRAAAQVDPTTPPKRHVVPRRWPSGFLAPSTAATGPAHNRSWLRKS
jgi:hypothetical protein